MIKLSEKHHKLLKKIYRGVGAAALTFALAGCDIITQGGYGMYGMPPEYGMPVKPIVDVRIYGVVKSLETNEGLQGIMVFIGDSYSSAYTDENGFFDFYTPMQEKYNLIFLDIKEREGGSFMTLRKQVTHKDNGIFIEIYLDKEPAAL